MPVRRHADPNNVQHVWDGVRVAGLQHNSADFAKICKYLQNTTNCTTEQAELYVTQTIKDNLVLELKKIGNKGSIAGENTVVLKIPVQDLTLKNGGKDWYCIECHLAGDVQECGFCHRVYHTECSKNTRRKQMLFPNIKELRHFKNDQRIVNEPMEKEEIKSISDISNTDDASTCDNLVFNLENSLLNNSESECKLDISTNDNDDNVYDDAICVVCNLHKFDNSCGLEGEQLNQLLQYILERIKSWLPVDIKHKMDPVQQETWAEIDLGWRASQLWYQYMDMTMMQAKIKRFEYAKLCEFQADVMTIQHNVAIFHGFDSQEYGAAELMLRDCCHDLLEIRVCSDCYKHSNEKTVESWFCLPCKNPHSLVWAKQKGYPYWPAKVIKEMDNHVDVRFFGGKYERALLPRINIKPIETPKEKLQIKNSAAFRKALEEVSLHQKLAKDPSAIEKLLSTPKIKRPIQQRKPRNSTGPPAARRGKPRSSSVTSPVWLETPRSNTETPLRTRRQPSAKRETPDVYAFSESPEGQAPIPASRTRKRKSLSIEPVKKVSRKEEQLKHCNVNIHNIITTNSTNTEWSVVSNDSGGLDQVTSSTGCYAAEDSSEFEKVTENLMRDLDKPYFDAIEKMRKKLEATTDKTHLIAIATNCMRDEIDRIQKKNSNNIRKIQENHSTEISETKKKQWCYSCQQEAIYHCCWNTSYCSPACQQQHWMTEHKKVCRRKRVS